MGDTIATLFGKYRTLFFYEIFREFCFRQISPELLLSRKTDWSKKICLHKFWRYPDVQLTKRLFGMTILKGTNI